MIKLKVTRVEQHQITKNHSMYKIIDDFCFRSKNLYNQANYIIRQEFISNKKYISYYKMQFSMKTHELYKSLMSQSSQCTLQVLDRNWRSYFEAIKDWKENPSKYLGMPKLPKYLKKDGRFPWFIKNNTSYIKDGRLYFRLRVFNGYSFKTNVDGRLISVRFIPKGSVYTMEIVYIKEIESFNAEEVEPENICSIDLGVNNFVTMVNNIGQLPIIINGKGLKSINQYYNKRRAKLQSELMVRHEKYWSRELNIITNKRNNKIKNYIHNTSRFVINYCKALNIDTIVIGHNDKWKQECCMGDKNNQNFIQIPYKMLIHQLTYKCVENKIKLVITKESYTSGTSFLDNELPCKENYNKSRRIHRGLFKSNRGQLINSDVNGAYQIMRKVFPNVKADGIEGCLIPVIINATKVV